MLEPEFATASPQLTLSLIGDEKNDHWIKRWIIQVKQTAQRITVQTYAALPEQIDPEQYQFVWIDERATNPSTLKICGEQLNCPIMLTCHNKQKWEKARDALSSGISDCVPRSADIGSITNDIEQYIIRCASKKGG